MPRIRRRREVAELTYRTTGRSGQPVTMTAAAQILSSPRIQRSGGRSQRRSASHPWQVDAWTLYDEIGELFYAINWLSNAASRVRLFAARVTDDNDEPAPVDEGLAAELVAGWAGGPAGQAQFLGRIGAHLALVGDSYIVGRTLGPDGTPPDAPDASGPGGGPDALPPDGENVTEMWQAYSTEETSYDSEGWRVDDGDEKFVVGPRDLIVRCWRPHPRRYSEAQSPVRSSLPVLRELRGLTMHVSAQVDSRLAGAGILLVPQSATFAAPAGAHSGDAADGEDPFVRDLIASMVTPIKDRDSAAAVVPLVLKVPDDAVGKIEHISFASPLDDKAKDLRDEALRRLALGMDMPPEVILGMSDSNHWSAWQIDAASIRLHVAPMVATICLALTVGWLQPALEDAGESDASDYLVWFDTGPLEERLDRSANAKELYDRFAIGPDTLRRECGFGDDDAPTPAELTRMVLLKLLDRVSDVTPILRALNIDALPEAGGQDDQGGSGGEAPEVSPPERGLPQRDGDPPGSDAETGPPPAEGGR